jgi:hypothetical protein
MQNRPLGFRTQLRLRPKMEPECRIVVAFGIETERWLQHRRFHHPRGGTFVDAGIVANYGDSP